MRAAAAIAVLSIWAASVRAEPPALYRLPYADGQAFTITQARGGFITSHYGPENLHAVDISMPEGTPVLAARGGVVIAGGWRDGTGNVVRVMHADGTIGNYAHLMHGGVVVRAGEKVEAGRVLGYSGATGYASGPHLHFAVTRIVSDGAEEVSEPVRFYVGNPPRSFVPRVGMAVLADYSAAAAAPAPAVPALAKALAPTVASRAAFGDWRLLLVVGLAIAAMALYYRCTR
jgi:murein DD-endopeptidase MepM/ murein hydrolase activator NlpD